MRMKQSKRVAAMGIAAKICHSIGFLSTYGLRNFGREVSCRLGNYYHERRLGVDTSAPSRLRSPDDNPDNLIYVPINYRACFEVLDQIPLDKKESVFLDYGCGKGRALVVASTFPYRRVIGVELSEELVVSARENVAAMRGRRAKSVDLVAADAALYPVPDDANVIFFFNPFSGEVLRKVIDNLYASLKRAPRTVYIIFFNKIHFEALIKGRAGIRRIFEAEVYPNISCGLFILESPGSVCAPGHNMALRGES